MTTPIDTASVAIVPDFSRFAREARAGIDAALRGLVGDVERAFAGVERAAGDAGQDIGREFQAGGESAERALREVDNQARRSFNEVSRQASQAATGISTKLGGALGVAKAGLAALAIGAGAGLAALTGFGLKAAADLEQVQVSFDSLLGSAEAGKSVFTDLQQFAASTPFEFPEVAAAAQKFLAFNDAIGLSDAQLKPFLTTLGDITSVTGAGAEGMSRVTLALGQIASRGKVSLEEINQISEALPGFSGVAAIAAATGKTTAETMDLISSGSLDATTGVAALLKGMQQFPGAAGAMEKQSQTLLGVFSTFKDTLSQTLVAAFQPVIPAIKDSLTQVTPILQSALQGLAPILGNLLSGILPLIGQLVQAIVPILGPIVEALGEGLKVIGPALLPLGEALGGIASALAPILPMIAELATLAAQQLAPIIAQLVPAFTDLVGAVLPLILDILTPLLPIIGQVATLLASVLAPIVKLIGKIFEKLGPPILAIVMALADLLMPIIEALAPVIDQLITAFLPFIDIIAALLPPFVEIVKAFMPLTDVIVALLPAVTAIITPLAQLVALIVGFLAQKAIVPLVELLAKALTVILAPLTLLPPLLESFSKWLNSIDWGAVGAAIGGFFADAWRKVSDFFEGIGRWFARLPGQVRLGFELFKQAVIAKSEEVLAFVLSIPGRILNALGNLGNLLINAGRNLVQGLWNGISSLGGWLWSKVKQFVIDNTLGAVQRALGISSPSKVFADQVGREIPAGIAMGIEAGLPALQSMLNGLVPSGAAQQPVASLGGVTINLGGVHFAGVVPTETEARRTGAAAMAGAVDALRRRDLALAVRTA